MAPHLGPAGPCCDSRFAAKLNASSPARSVTETDPRS